MTKKLELKNIFNIDDEVYHKVSGEKSIVVMVRIVVDSTHVPVYEYLVSSDYDKVFWVDEMLLSDTII